MTMTEAAKIARFQNFIDDAIAAHPIEVGIVSRTIKALADAGTPVVSVWDTVEDVPATTEREIFEQVFNLDEAFLKTAGGSWVRLTMGEEWDTICDYTTDLEETLTPVNKYIEENGY